MRGSLGIVVCPSEAAEDVSTEASMLSSDDPEERLFIGRRGGKRLSQARRNRGESICFVYAQGVGRGRVAERCRPYCKVVVTDVRIPAAHERVLASRF